MLGAPSKSVRLVSPARQRAALRSGGRARCSRRPAAMASADLGLDRVAARHQENPAEPMVVFDARDAELETPGNRRRGRDQIRIGTGRDRARSRTDSSEAAPGSRTGRSSRFAFIGPGIE